MSADVEELLERLGESWDAAVSPITLDEVRAEATGAFETADGTERPHGRADTRWWSIVACGLLLIGTVVSLAVIDRNDADAPLVTIETTTPPTVPGTTTPTPSTSTPTTSPTTIPLESFADGAWWPLESPVVSCSDCSGIVLDDGRVALVNAGNATRGGVVELFDPTTATFSVGAPVQGRFWAGMIQLQDGRLLLTGLNGEITIADLDDGSSEVVRRDGNSATALQLADGRVLLFDKSTASELDLTTNQITRLADRGNAQRAEAPTALAELGDGDVLVADHIESHIFDPESGTFRPFDDSTVRISWIRRLDDGRFLVARAGGSEFADAQIYDHATGTFADVAGLELPLIGSPGQVSAALLRDSRLLVIQQPDRLGSPNPGATIHDLVTGAVQEIEPPTGHRTWAQPIALADGRVLIVGNYPGNGGGFDDPDGDTAELFAVGDPQLPEDCCTRFADDVEIGWEWTDDSLPPLVGHPLRLTVKVPAGALVGAVEAEWTVNEERDHTSGTQDGGELSLPADCDDGCTLHIDATTTPTPQTIVVRAAIRILYESTPRPPVADSITLAIDAQP